AEPGPCVVRDGHRVRQEGQATGSGRDVPQGARGRGGVIRVVQAPLEEAETAAVLWPVTAEWDAVTAPMRRFELAAGPEPAEQARRLGELPVGSAVITGAGNLRAQFIVHAIVRSMDEPVTAPGVRRALQNGLRRL